MVDNGLVKFHGNAFQGIGADDHGGGPGIKKKAQGTAVIDAPLHVNAAGSAQFKGNAAAGDVRSLGGEKGNQ